MMKKKLVALTLSAVMMMALAVPLYAAPVKDLYLNADDITAGPVVETPGGKITGDAVRLLSNKERVRLTLPDPAPGDFKSELQRDVKADAKVDVQKELVNVVQVTPVR